MSNFEPARTVHSSMAITRTAGGFDGPLWGLPAGEVQKLARASIDAVGHLLGAPTEIEPETVLLPPYGQEES